MRWTSAGAGDFEVETITRPQRGTSVTLHLREDADEYLSTWKLKSIIGKYSDHISLPILMRKEEWKEGEEGKGGEMVAHRRVGNRQPGQRPVDPAEEGHHDRAVPGVLQADQPRPRAAAGLGAQPGGRLDRIHPAAVHPGARAVRPVEPREGGRRQAVRQARLHHGRGRGAAAGLPALRQGRDRLVRPAAQRQPRTAAGKPRREGDPRRPHQARAGHAGRPGQAEKDEAQRGGQGQVRQVLRASSARC